MTPCLLCVLVCKPYDTYSMPFLDQNTYILYSKYACYGKASSQHHLVQNKTLENIEN